MARLLTLLFEVTALFDMTTRIELVLLQKTMVVVEGVARKLDPRLNMWATAEPVVGDWIAENLGPRGRLEDVGAAICALLGQGRRRRAAARIEQFGRADDGDRARLSARPRLSSTPLWVIAVVLDLDRGPAWPALTIVSNRHCGATGDYRLSSCDSSRTCR